ncbi:M28 family metallopeptidase [Pengzhenrongella sicca]|uniref:Zn-dependent exopeptidase M28 n=1 Tax=Pengzhenrongella sicca TaxID=2819238 RepID=A0A8A4ZIK5_9MICO|nr:M28 family metallopeptidase [Pengzhenrongella sicca]QTE30843.1 Zn-dependent exopeptidase M28 [Pengzhenrongella sicca]
MTGYVVAPDERSGRADDVAPRGTHWARFADRVVTWAPEPARLGRGARTADRLLLITQVGRSFQDAHPDLTPVLEHGRHLVVADTDPSLLAVTPDAEPGADEHAHWRVEPLPADAVVVGLPAAPPARVDPAIAGLLGELSSPLYAADVAWLAGLPTRHSLSTHFATAAGWAAARMTALGFAATRVPITVGAGTSENVIGDRAGVGSGPRDLVLITAHLDSVNLAGGPAASAPGADDNASGSAGVLELARVLAAHAWRADVRLILFGGEEQGLHGSQQYVAALPGADRARLRAVLNMDMIATRNSPAPTVLLEGATVSAGLIADLATAAATYTGLRVETSLSPFASDHVPFITAGLPAVLTIEGADSANGHIHSANDTLAFIDHAFALDILRMNLAALAGWLGSTSGAPRPAGSAVSWGPGRLDVFVVGTDSTLQHTWWEGAGWQPSPGGFETLGGTIARP